jgi:hypothetical protein
MGYEPIGAVKGRAIRRLDQVVYRMIAARPPPTG